ncbi:MAG: hypothetical protein ABI548_07075 [Polyangiaceae bacterium]
MPKIRQQQQDRFARDAVGRHLAKDLTEAFGEGSFSTETACVDYGVAPRRARMVLDEKGRIVQSLTPLGRATRFLFENDRVRGVQSSAGVVSYFDYDAAGFPQGVQRSDGATEHYAYSLPGDIHQRATVTGCGHFARYDLTVRR